MAGPDLGIIEPGNGRVRALRTLSGKHCKSHLMQYLTFGCAFRSIDKKPCPEIANSVRLLAAVVRDARPRHLMGRCVAAQGNCLSTRIFAKAEGAECQMY
jgi:hypothetical protein